MHSANEPEEEVENPPRMVDRPLLKKAILGKLLYAFRKTHTWWQHVLVGSRNCPIDVPCLSVAVEDALVSLGPEFSIPGRKWEFGRWGF